MTVDVLLFTGSSIPYFTRPIGAYRIATELRKHGYTVQVIDMFPYIVNKDPKLLFLKQFIDKYVGPNTLWVGFSSTFMYDVAAVNKEFAVNDVPTLNDLSNTLSVDTRYLHNIKYYITTRSPKCKLVLGGSKSSAYNVKIIDIYLEGYADSTVIEMTRWIEGKNPFMQTQHVGYGAVGILHDYKAQNFDFVNSSTKWHESDHIFPEEALPIEISRGCIFNCSFCSYPLNGKKKTDYIRDPGVLREEFTRNYEQFGTTDYIFADDTHNDSVEKLQFLYDQVYSKLPFRINFYTYLRLDLLHAHPESAVLLKESGLRGAFFGIESMNYESAKAVGKGITPKRIEDTLHRLKEDIWKQDVTLSGGFIIGLPHDTEQTISEWLPRVIQRDFPLDSVNLYPLGLTKLNAETNRKLWTSDLERNPEKFGYSFPTAEKPGHWINDVTGMNFALAREMSEMALGIARLNGKKQNGSFNIPGLLNLGYLREEIVEDNVHNSITKFYHQRRLRLNEKYFNAVLNA